MSKLATALRRSEVIRVRAASVMEADEFIDSAVILADDDVPLLLGALTETRELLEAMLTHGEADFTARIKQALGRG